jgi:hypothetical protein
VTVTTMVNLPPAALDRIFRASTLGSPKIQVPTFGDGVIVFEPSAGTAVPGVIFLDDDQPEPGLEGQLILDPTDIAAGVLVGLAVGGGVGAVAGIGFVLGRQGLRLLARVLARRAEKTPQGAQDKRFPALSELREREEGSVMMCCRLAGEPSRPSTARDISEFAGTDIPRRELGRAFERLKADALLPNDFQGRFTRQGDLLDPDGKFIANVFDFLP